MTVIAKILPSTKSNPHFADVEVSHSCQLCEWIPCHALVSQHLPGGVNQMSAKHVDDCRPIKYDDLYDRSRGSFLFRNEVFQAAVQIRLCPVRSLPTCDNAGGYVV